MTLIFAEDGSADTGAGRALAGPAGWKARIGCAETDLSGGLQAGSQTVNTISRSGIFNTDFIYESKMKRPANNGLKVS